MRIFRSAKFLKNLHSNSYFDSLNDSKFVKAANNDLNSIKDWDTANKFFEAHTELIHPFSWDVRGVIMWEQLMISLEKANPNKFRDIHKGTAYWWAAIYDLRARRFQTAFQWMDYAFEQDKRIGEIEKPAFFTLTFQPGKGQNDLGQTDMILDSINKLTVDLKKYDSKFKENTDSIRSIIKEILLKENRPVRAAIISFMSSLLEREELERLLKIAPNGREGQMALTDHLVNITLILETLIKQSKKARRKLPKSKWKYTTLDVLYREVIAKKYGWNFLGGRMEKSGFTFLNPNFSEGFKSVVGELNKFELNTIDKMKVSFSLAYKVRNSFHHTYNQDHISEKILKNLDRRIYYAICAVIKDFY